MPNLARRLFRLALALLCALATAPAAQAGPGDFMDVYYVINLNDAGAGSLRQAILSANGTPAASVIDLEVSGQLTLASALPAITSAAIIDGSGETFVIDGQGLYRALTIGSVPVAISNLTVQNTAAFGNLAGGGIVSDSSLTLHSVTVRHSTSTGGPGGGVYAAGDLTINGGRFEHNAADDEGGAFYAGGALVLTGTQIISNTARGGGGAFAAVSAQVSGGLFEDNHSLMNLGGGLYVEGPLELTGTHFMSNTANASGGGAVVLSESPPALTNVHFEHNRSQTGFGGGLAIFTPVTATAVLTNASFVGNQAYQGGGLFIRRAVITGGLFERNSDEIESGGLTARHAVINGTAFISNTTQFGRAAGAYVSENATLTGVWFAGNTSSSPLYAGGLYAGQAALSDSRFEHNQGATGGGVSASGNLAITSTVFLHNSARLGGGLAHLAGGGSLVNALFARNTAAEGGASLYLHGTGTDQLKHVTIASSVPVTTSAISTTKEIVQLQNVILSHHAVGLSIGSGFVVVDNALFYANGQPIVGTIATENNRVSGDPLFVNPAADDYHLQLGSPAVDAGMDAGISFDFDGDPRPSLQVFDIGYDEVEPLPWRRLLPLVLR
jgi:hypothetical protein